MVNKSFVAIFLILSAQANVLAENTVTQSISVPNENTLQMILHAKGDQIFSCVHEGHAFFWKWQAPDAQLFEGEKQTPVGSHSAGPTWTHQDGSSVTAKIAQKVDAPEKAAAPWLLLEATKHQGKGVFAETVHILRINTQGGIAPPAEGCTEKQLGAENRVPYSADYNFYRN